MFDLRDNLLPMTIILLYAPQECKDLLDWKGKLGF